jgi:type III secretory pathway component EscS
MSSSTSSNIQLSIAFLGAGDLIDRTVRFYRKNFWTFVWIAAPPIVIGTIISVGWTILGRKLFSVSLSNDPVEMVFYYIFSGFGNLIIWLTETVAILTVMGGASRNFVRHLLFGEPVTFRETYKNVRQRLGGLIFASITLSILIGFFGAIILNFGLFFPLFIKLKNIKDQNL